MRSSVDPELLERRVEDELVATRPTRTAPIAENERRGS
jgi:hypothetical protein